MGLVFSGPQASNLPLDQPHPYHGSSECPDLGFMLREEIRKMSFACLRPIIASCAGEEGGREKGRREEGN